MRGSFGLALIVTLVPPGPPAAAQAPRTGPQRLVEHRAFQSEPMLVEAAAGLLVGVGTSMVLARVGATVLGPRGGEDPGLAGAMVGFAAGLTVGTALGVHAVARAYGLPARYEEAAAGALAGVLLVPALPIDIDHRASILAVFAVPTVGAVLASSAGSASRWTGPVVRPAPGGVGVEMSVAF